MLLKTDLIVKEKQLNIYMKGSTVIKLLCGRRIQVLFHIKQDKTHFKHITKTNVHPAIRGEHQ